MQFAINEEWRKDDRTLGVKMIKTGGGGHHSWTTPRSSPLNKLTLLAALSA